MMSIPLEPFTIYAYMERHKYDSFLKPSERKSLEDGKVSFAEVEFELEERKRRNEVCIDD